MGKSVLIAYTIGTLFFNAEAWSTSKHAPSPAKPRIDHSNEDQLGRRNLLQCGSLLVGSLLLPGRSCAGEGLGTDQSEAGGVLSAAALADLLHPIPTFAIVDKQGVPYMVVGEDAKVTGYFFTTYKEASRILKLASSSADKAIAKAKSEGQLAEEIGSNPWKTARISSIPLDVAVTLVTRSTASFGGGNYFRISPADEDVDDALALTGQDDLAEGKVPLFYYADFSVDINGEPRSPLYFRKSELEEQFRKKNPKLAPPPILVTELFALLAEIVKPGGVDNDLKSLAFVAPRESELKKKECEKAGGKEPAFFIGKRIIVL